VPVEENARPPLSVGGPQDRYWVHALLFLATLACATYAGADLAGRYILYEQDGGWWIRIGDGLRYAVPLLFFLSVHEFGHYFVAQHHRVSVTLPYYIPSPFIFIPLNIGTFGAVIRIRDQVPSTRKLYDIGIAGPIAGFVASLVVLGYGVLTLPDAGYYLDLPFHNELKDLIYRGQALPELSPSGLPTIYIGQTLLFSFLTMLVPNLPPMYEMYHFPILFAGWLGLFFTALNLLPVGQLDGGHILYALVGRKWHGRIARGFVMLLLLSAAIGFTNDVNPLIDSYLRFGQLSAWVLLTTILFFFLNKIFSGNLKLVGVALISVVALVVLAARLGPTVTQYGYTGWFFWCALIVLFIQVDHPPVLYHEPLTPGRRLLGIASLIIFALCFSIRPIYVG